MWIREEHEEIGKHISVDDYIGMVDDTPDGEFLDGITLSILSARLTGLSDESLKTLTGIDWLDLLIQHNESTEEYEMCSILKKIKDIN